MSDITAFIYGRMLLKPTLKKVRQATEKSPKEKLQEIVNNYESSAWHHKLLRFVFYYDFFEENLAYKFARDLLSGKFSWVNADWEEAIEENRKRDLERRYEERRWAIEKGRGIELFSGSLQEFENLKGCGYQIIDNGKEDKTMIYGDSYPCKLRPMSFLDSLGVGTEYEILSELVNLGVEALVRFGWKNEPPAFHYGRGLPVRKKSEISKV